MDKNFAPFSAPLYESVTFDQLRPIKFISVFIGLLAWPCAREHARTFPTRTIALSPYSPPDTYRYPVKGCKILIRETYRPTADLLYALSVAEELIHQGAAQVFFLNEEFDSTNLIIFKGN